MAENVTVTLSLPPRVWWRLAKRGDSLGISVAELLARAAVDVERGRAVHAPRTSTRERIADLLERGFSVRDIAIELHCTVENVYYHRSALKREASAA